MDVEKAARRLWEMFEMKHLTENIVEVQGRLAGLWHSFWR